MKTIGVLGLGSMGLRHAKNLITLGHKVIGYDPDEQRRKLLVEFGGEWFDPIDQIIQRAEAIVIASPSNQHLPHLEIVNNQKPVFVEKPLATSWSGISSIVQEAKEKNNIIFVGCNLRFHACVKQAKQMLDMGAIGKPIWASVTVGQFTHRPLYIQDGVILNWGSHEIDLALYLLGSAKIACASVHTTIPINGYDDIADFVLIHESGTRSNIHLDYISRPEIRATTIIGNKGQLIIDLVNNWICLIDLDGKKTDVMLKNDWNDNYLEEMKAFLDRIDGKQTLGASGEDGLRALEIILDVRRLAGLI